ncbi:MAG: hypothetical protein K2W92_02865 [Alphaproteobacteria bacterium]|nr:hypothetical protein [Alphaproteobacteria bacterium]
MKKNKLKTTIVEVPEQMVSDISDVLKSVMQPAYEYIASKYAKELGLDSEAVMKDKYFQKLVTASGMVSVIYATYHDFVLIDEKYKKGVFNKNTYFFAVVLAMAKFANIEKEVILDFLNNDCDSYKDLIYKFKGQKQVDYATYFMSGHFTSKYKEFSLKAKEYIKENGKFDFDSVINLVY